MFISGMNEKIQSGQFAWIGGGSSPFERVHVENVAHSVELSLTKGRSKEIYFVTDDTPSTFREFMEPMLASQGIHAGNRSLPNGLVRFLAILLEGIWRLLRIKSAPPLNPFNLPLLDRHGAIALTKSIRNLATNPSLVPKRV